MGNRKCLYCCKDLTEADILQFNKFCSVAHQEEYIVEFIKDCTAKFQNIDKRDTNQTICTDIFNNINLFNGVRSISQIEANIITLDRAAQAKEPGAIALVCKGRRFIRYRIGDSEIRTVPSKFTGYVANNVAFHSLMKNWPYRHGDERIGRDWRHGFDTNGILARSEVGVDPTLDLSRTDFISYLSTHKEYEQQYKKCLAEHRQYCSSLGGTPSNYGHGTVRFFNPDEPLIISP